MTSTDLVPFAGAVAVPSDEALLEAFMASPRQAAHGVRNRLARARALRALARFLNCPLIEATTAQLGVWLSRPIADATRISTLSHLHAFYAWAVAEGLIESSPTEVFRGRGTAGLTLAPTPAAMHMNGDDEVSVALVQVAPSVELYRVTLELGVCEGCGDQDDRLRRLGGVGAPLCPTCYQRGKRAARKAGEALRDASWRTTAADLRSELIVRASPLERSAATATPCGTPIDGSTSGGSAWPGPFPSRSPPTPTPSR